MTGIKVDIYNLDSHVKDIKNRRIGAELLERATELEPVGTGLMEDELTAYNRTCNTLLRDLDLLYQKVESFLSCTRDGIVTADEYAAMMIENGSTGAKGGAAG